MEINTISSRIASSYSEIRSDQSGSLIVEGGRLLCFEHSADASLAEREERIPECVIEELARFCELLLANGPYYRREINDGKRPGTTIVLSLLKNRRKRKEAMESKRRSRYIERIYRRGSKIAGPCDARKMQSAERAVCSIVCKVFHLADTPLLRRADRATQPVA